MNIKHFEIDLVYLWVDGSDPEWLKKKETFTGVPSGNSETDTEGRYANNDELKYSLRSAEKYAPWIRQIFIVTDNQIPIWLNTNHPKVKVIDLTEIMPPEVLPSFNSNVIECHLYRIPGLSEYFLYANDDMFFNAAVSPDFFFAEDGYPYVRLKRKILGKWHFKLKSMIVGLGHYGKILFDSMRLVEKKFGIFYSGIPHHNIDGYLRSDNQRAVEEVFREEFEKSKLNRMRAFSDVQRVIFSYYMLAIGHAHLRYVTRNESSRILIYKHNFTEYINRYHPLLFCLNDDQYVTNKQRQQVQPFLESLFPVKSPFEK
jgi:hypothetical protein